MKKCIILLIFISISLSADRFTDMDIVFINGIQNDEVKDVAPSAKELSRAIQKPSDRVKAIYNNSESFMQDVMETYKYARFDGTNGGKDFAPFWQAVRNGKYISNEVKEWWKKEIVDGFLKYQGDYQKVYNKIKSIRASNPKPNKKLLILSHSEGTVVANLVMRELIEEYGDEAKQCTRLVSIATPVSTSVGIRNDGRYTTSNRDLVIASIRGDIGSMPSNINTSVDTLNDPLGHGLRGIYLNRSYKYRLNAIGQYALTPRPHEHIRNKIIADINAMADEINEECVVYSTVVSNSYNSGTLYMMENGESRTIDYTVWLKKNGEVYKTINLPALLTFKYDNGEEGHADTEELDGEEHFHISCNSTISGLCSALRRKVPSQFKRGSSGNWWTISTYNIYFRSKITSALYWHYKK